MKRSFIAAACIVLCLCSCDWAAEKSKKAVNKSGELVGKAGSEFADGLSKGIEQSFNSKVEISQDLRIKGLETGKVTFHGTDSTSDNVVTAYLIFNNNINQLITVKVFDVNGDEYGRSSQQVAGNKGEAKYFDFPFDPRTNIDGKGKITFE